MAQPTLKEMTRHGGLKVGTFVVEFSTPGIGQLLKAAGCEFVLLDMEHSGFGFDTLKQMLRYMQAAEMPTIVRVPSREYHHAARAMDAGAEGIMLPMIGSATVARELLSYVKYAPEGSRGVALNIAHDRYQPGPVLQKLRDANARTTFFALIETAEGVENADEIAALDGVDALWIGHFDLTVSMGIPGQFDHPDFAAAVKRIIAGCRKRDKSLGRLVPNAATGIALFKQGFDFICHSGDVWMLQQAMQTAADELRAGCKAGRKRGSA
jgi:2-dehydro-3-deoxyglucarate aldolase/4-hydroxy-2-oxoheptanedioate aldolase